MEYFVNFQCHLGDKRRCSVFGRDKDGKLEVFILKCNKNDQFDKSLGRVVYSKYLTGQLVDGIIELGFGSMLFHPEIVLVPLGEDTPRFVFNKFCHENFYKKQTVLTAYVEDVLYKESERITVSKPKRYEQK